jgi:hypothetical protein
MGMDRLLPSIASDANPHAQMPMVQRRHRVQPCGALVKPFITGFVYELQKALSRHRQHIQRHLHHHLRVVVLHGDCRLHDAIVWARLRWRRRCGVLQCSVLAASGAVSYLT